MSEGESQAARSLAKKYPALGEDELQAQLERIPKWQLKDIPNQAGRQTLYRAYVFKSFRDAIAFMADLAPHCDQVHHHPKWENNYQTVRVQLTTWDAKQRVTQRDIDMALVFERAFEAYCQQHA